MLRTGGRIEYFPLSGCHLSSELLASYTNAQRVMKKEAALMVAERDTSFPFSLDVAYLVILSKCMKRYVEV